MNEHTRAQLAFVAVVAFLLGMMAAMLIFAAFDPDDDAPAVTATEFPDQNVVCFTSGDGYDTESIECLPVPSENASLESGG